MRRTPLLLASAAAAVVLGATACGGDPSPDPSATTDGVGVIGTADPTTPPPATTTTSGPGPVAEDCFTYDSQVLVKRYEAGVHVIHPDHGPELFRVYGGPGEPVGDQALAVAQLFDTICYIGRGNPLGSPEFVFEYWNDPTGASASPLLFHSEDCVNYDPSAVTVESLGGGSGWRVTADGIDLQHFATEADANLGAEVLEVQDLLCYVRTSTPSPGDDPADITYTFNSGD